METKSSETSQKRTHQRTTVFLQSGVEAGGRSVRGTIRSLSASGASLVMDAPAKIDDRVRLSLRNIGEVCGRIAWIRDKRIGIEFDALIDPALALSVPAGPAVPTYGNVYNNTDHRRPGFGQQRLRRKE